MKEIQTDDAPDALGPYSQGIVDGNRVFVSGQGPVDPETGAIVGDDVGVQTEQTLANIDAICSEAETSLDSVVKTTVFLTDMDDYDEMNEVYQETFSTPFPARSAVGVRELPIDIRVEIEAIATID